MLYFIPTPIGNISDISIRAISVLKQCKIAICEDTRVTKSLIKLLNERFDAGIEIDKFLSLHSHNEDRFFKDLAPNFFSVDVAYLSDAGMPCISDPGVSLINYAIDNSISYEVLPGANAALVAVASSGFLQKEFVFLGFLPNGGKDRKQALHNAMNLAYPCIIYESPKRILKLLNEIKDMYCDRKIFAIKEISKKFQKSFLGSAGDILDSLNQVNLNGEWCVVVDKNNNIQNEKIVPDDILELNVSAKVKAKLLAKLTNKSVKEIYHTLIQD